MSAAKSSSSLQLARPHDGVRDYPVHPHLYQSQAGAPIGGEGVGRGGGGNGIGRGQNVGLRAPHLTNVNVMRQNIPNVPQVTSMPPGSLPEAMQSSSSMQQPKPPDMKQSHLPGNPTPMQQMQPPYRYFNPNSRGQPASQALTHRSGQNPGLIMQQAPQAGQQAMFPHQSMTMQPVFLPSSVQMQHHPNYGVPSFYPQQTRPQSHIFNMYSPMTPFYQVQGTQNFAAYQGAVINRNPQGNMGAGTHHIPSNLSSVSSVVSSNPMQQVQQQHQPLPAGPMPPISISQSEPYTNYTPSIQNLPEKAPLKKRERALAIVDPDTGKNITEEIYNEANTMSSSVSSSTPEVNAQNEESKKKVAADFASQVAKVASEPAKSQQQQQQQSEQPQQPLLIPAPVVQHAIVPLEPESEVSSAMVIEPVVDDVSAKQEELEQPQPQQQLEPPSAPAAPVVVDEKFVQRSKTKKNKYRDKKEGSDMDAFAEADKQIDNNNDVVGSEVVVSKSPQPDSMNLDSEQKPTEQEPEMEEELKLEEVAVETVAVEQLEQPKEEVAEPEQQQLEPEQTNSLIEETSQNVPNSSEEKAPLETAEDNTDELPEGEVTEESKPENSTVVALKYHYDNDQWSPINMSGKKVYSREFLVKLQHDSLSKVKPSNLPDLDVVLKETTKNRNPVTEQFRAFNTPRHDLLPGFLKNMGPKVGIGSSGGPGGGKKMGHQGNKLNKPRMSNVIQYSLPQREDVKLRETENAWKPTRLNQVEKSEEDAKTEALYKKVRSVLNKLTPQKFGTLVDQVRQLPIDTQDRLQGVIDLVFEKAIDEPNFAVEYAMLCKELQTLVVKNADGSTEQPQQAQNANQQQPASDNFRKLMLTKCQNHFEKTSFDENMHNERIKEIEECTDLERKKELQLNLEEEERRMRLKSVGNIKFVGELFKLQMLTTNIMHTCIRHLLKQTDEENLECLCKLVTTIGKTFETHPKGDLSIYFKEMTKLSQNKQKISSRIRFMLQDVIDLRKNNWVPRRDDSNPKTMDQIQREAESEQREVQMNLQNMPINTPRKEDRFSDKGKRGGGGGRDTGPRHASADTDGWNTVGSISNKARFNVEPNKLKTKAAPTDDMTLGNRSNYQWGKPQIPKIATPNKFASLQDPPEPARSTTPVNIIKPSFSKLQQQQPTLDSKNNNSNNNNSNIETVSPMMPSVLQRQSSAIKELRIPPLPATVQPVPMDEVRLNQSLENLLEDWVAAANLEETVQVFCETFHQNNHAEFVREIVNTVLEKPENYRQMTSKLLAQLLKCSHLSITHFNKGLSEILEVAGDLIIDVPKVCNYIAQILVYPVVENAWSLGEMKNLLQTLLPKDYRSQGLAGKIVAELMEELGNQKGNNWVEQKWKADGLRWSDLTDKADEVVKDHKLEFINDQDKWEPDWARIEENLPRLLREGNFDAICCWIQDHVKGGVKEPNFIRLLMTAILDTSIEIHEQNKWSLDIEIFGNLQKLIQRYVDADENLELLCLFAIQAFVHKHHHPAGLIQKVVTNLSTNNALSNEAFLAWEKNDDPAEEKGKREALDSLAEFFVPLKEADDVSSDEGT